MPEVASTITSSSATCSATAPASATAVASPPASVDTGTSGPSPPSISVQSSPPARARGRDEHGPRMLGSRSRSWPERRACRSLGPRTTRVLECGRQGEEGWDFWATGGWGGKQTVGRYIYHTTLRGLTRRRRRGHLSGLARRPTRRAGGRPTAGVGGSSSGRRARRASSLTSLINTPPSWFSDCMFAFPPSDRYFVARSRGVRE